jgi:hypothetical protein
MMARAGSTADPMTYPALYGILTQSLPRLPAQQPRVFREFCRYTGMAPPMALAALTYGTLPMVAVRELAQLKYGFYHPGRDEIVLQWTFVTDSEGARGARFTGVLALLESKVLHEMVHWGWYQVHRSLYEPPSRYGYTDMAWDFEHDAYGRPLDVYSTGLAHVVIDPLVPRPRAMR